MNCPKHKTRSGIKTRSTPGGGPNGFNELRFEDSKGHEEIYVHAERNLKTVVESAENRSVGASRTTTIHKEDKLTVEEGDRTTEVLKGYDFHNVHEGDRVANIIEGDDTCLVHKGDHIVNVRKGNQYLLVDEKNVIHKAPKGEYRVEAKEIVLKGTQSITFQVGGSCITLTPSGISLQIGGSLVKLDPSKIHSTAGQINSMAMGSHQIRGVPVLVNC